MVEYGRRRFPGVDEEQEKRAELIAKHTAEHTIVEDRQT